MKRFVFAGGVLLAMLLSSSNLSAQVIINVKPVRPKVVVVKPVKLKRNHIWVDGHWKYNKKMRKYVWVKASWLKARRGYSYVTGHWKKVPKGWIWVEGRWRRT